MEVGAETVSGSEKVFEEPRFDFDCSYSYGRFRAPIPPLNRHFVPRLAKLKVLKLTWYKTCVFLKVIWLKFRMGQ